jgi:hypothetical protein
MLAATLISYGQLLLEGAAQGGGFTDIHGYNGSLGNDFTRALILAHSRYGHAVLSLT